MKKRGSHILKGNKGVEMPRLMIFFDTETPDENWKPPEGQHILKVGYALFYQDQGGRAQPTEESLTFYTPSEFWDFVEAHTYNKMKTYVFAHNLDFDFRVVRGYEELMNRGWVKGFDTFDSNPGIKNFKKERKSLLFLDTMNYFRGSLADLGKTVGLPKLETPFGVPDIDRWKQYCKRDVEIIRKVILDLQVFIKRENLGGFAPTVAGIAFHAFKHRFMSQPIYIHAFDSLSDRERLSNKGGRCEAFYQGDVSDKNLSVVDINSFYPFLMKTYDYPVRYKKWLQDIEVMELMAHCKRECVIANVLFELYEPSIGVKRERLLFPVGRIREWLTTPEIELVYKTGRILEVATCIVYEKAKVFEPFVDYFYTQRINAKNISDETRSYFFKTIMNSLYGKFGQHTEEWVSTAESSNEPNQTFFEIDLETERKYLVRIINGILQLKTGYFYGFDSFIAIPAHVTAYGRCYLWELIAKAGIENVYYVDTDSMFVTPEGLKALSAVIDNTELGKLKLEDDRIYWIKGAKWYMNDKGLKLKGVPKNSKEMAKNMWEVHGIEKCKTALRKGRLNEVWSYKRVKTISPLYKKGTVQNSGRIAPFVFMDL
jgi:hypothetical protein